MAVDERNFRSAYYEKVGFKNVEEKRSIEILLKEKPLDLQKLKQFCLRFGVPSTHKNFVWKLLLGVLPMHENCRDFVYDQRRQVHCNLRHALTIMRSITNDTPKYQIFVAEWLLEKGKLRPDINNYDAEQCLVAIIKSVISMFESDIDIYWISRNFYELTSKFHCEIPKLIEAAHILLEKEDVNLYKYLTRINVLEELPLGQWFEVSFAGVISDIDLGKVWDKICSGSYKILIYVAIVILTCQSHKLMKCTELDEILRLITNLSSERSEIIVNKSIELWKQQGSPLTAYDKPKPQV